MSDDAAREALIRAIGRWAEARDRNTLAQLAARMQPGEQTAERAGKTWDAMQRDHVAMLDALDAFERATVERVERHTAATVAPASEPAAESAGSEGA